MVDYSLLSSLGDMDSFTRDANAAVMEALGDAADDLSLLIQGDEVQDFSAGSIVKGKVSGYAGDDFIVELGLKSEGVLERGEFDDPDSVGVGTEVHVLLEDTELDSGLVKISKRKADRIINWDNIMNTKKEGDPVSGKVSKRSRAACSSTSACRSSCRRRKSTSAGRARSATGSAATSTR